MRDETKNAALAGIFVIVSGVLLVAGIYIFGERSRLFKKHYVLRAEFGNVQGLAVGATVRVAGVLVGTVRRVAVPPRADDKQVTVYMSIETIFMEKIRKDSTASIRTLGMLGDKYVEISIGSSGTKPVPDGGLVNSEEPLDIYEIADEGRAVVGKLNRVAASLEAILTEFQKGSSLANLNKTAEALAGITTEVQNGSGALHTIIYDPKFKDIYANLEASAQAFRDLMDKAVKTDGGFGEVIFGKEYKSLATSMRETAESLNRIVSSIEKNDSALHSLIYDAEGRKTLTDIGHAAARLDDVLRKTQTTEGTIGLLMNDPSIWEDLQRLLGGAQRSSTLKYFIRRSMSANQ